MSVVNIFEIPLTACGRIWPSLAFQCWSRKWEENSHMEDFEDFHSKAARSRSLCLIANVHGKDIGYLVSYEDEPGTLFVYEGAVLPSFRRQGVFTSLLTYLQDWARNHHILLIFTTCNPKNNAIIQCLLKSGFRKDRLLSPDSQRLIRYLG